MRRFICILLVVGAFVAGVYVGRLPIVGLILDDATPISQTNSITPTTQTEQKTAPSPESKPRDGAIIKTTSLTEGQQKLLSALSIDASQIVITPTMIACAEAKVGAARLKEIENGATPSFAEGVTLLACYK